MEITIVTYTEHDPEEEDVDRDEYWQDKYEEIQLELPYEYEEEESEE